MMLENTGVTVSARDMEYYEMCGCTLLVQLLEVEWLCPQCAETHCELRTLARCVLRGDHCIAHVTKEQAKAFVERGDCFLKRKLEKEIE